MNKKFKLCPLGKAVTPFSVMVFIPVVILQWLPLMGGLLVDNIFYNILIAIGVLFVIVSVNSAIFLLFLGFGVPQYIEVDENKIYYIAKPYVHTGIKVAEKGDSKLYIGGGKNSNSGNLAHGVAEASRNINVKYAVTDIKDFQIHQNAFDRLIKTAHITFSGTTEVILDDATEKCVRSIEPPKVHSIRGVVLTKEFLQFAEAWRKSKDGSLSQENHKNN